MKRLLIGVLLIWGMTMESSADAADPSQVKVGTAGAEEFLKVLEQSSEPAAKRVFQATQRQVPRFIFVPGMFGSRLTLDNDDGSRTEIWGGDTSAFATGPLRYDPSQKVETGPLNSLDFIATHQDVYGEALSNLASHSIDSKMLSVFSYDWRQDNSVSAAKLQQYLCDNRAVLAGHKVYIIAHSMGGLIVKYWYKNFRNLDCVTTKETNNSEWLNVGGIILVGTPLYGAPATIAAFAGKFSLLPGGDTPFIGGLIQGFDRLTVSKEFIENGAMFESAYELLPDYMEECVGAKADLEPLKLRANDNSVSDIGSLFLPETWRDLGWPVQLPKYETRTEFYEKFLPTALKKALDFSCQVATYDLGSFVPTTYYYGLLPEPTTVTAYEVRESNGTGLLQDECRVTADDCRSLGDGTVPEFVARNEFVASPNDARSVPMKHMDLMKAPDLDAYVRNLIATDTRKILGSALSAELSTSPGSIKFISQLASQERVLLPMELCCTGLDDPIASINLKTMASLNLDQSQVSLLAKTSKNADSVAQWTRALSLMSDPNPEELFRGYDRAGFLAHAEGDYDGALQAWDGAISASKQITTKDISGDLGDLFVLQGDSWSHVGNLDEARAAYKSAVDLGNSAGSAGLTQLVRSPNLMFPDRLPSPSQ